MAACAPSLGQEKPSHPWADALRALDPADAPTPAHDLTAAYLRRQGDRLQIRVDLLSFTSLQEISIDIKIIDDSDPEAAPFLMRIPASDDPGRVVFDPGLDTVTVALPLSDLPERPRVEVYTPEDALTGLTLDGSPPTPICPDTVHLLRYLCRPPAGRSPAQLGRRAQRAARRAARLETPAGCGGDHPDAAGVARPESA